MALANIRIYAADMETKGSKIARLEIGESQDGFPTSSRKEVDRQYIIDAIRHRKVAITVVKGVDGAKVEVVSLGADSYLKTVRSSETKDNLGELPPIKKK